ncbi:hypothetical protein H7F15_03090 [Pontibacter sp. Tf4]|uniref:hypothetical protein n=1 Tax=Pontibacter sp. Tf4 TaxID=2761620 RepID=UPI001627780B|nr:hypothetical protein [Pontibacter sp. Tf4]MBB6610011.1 hypothetical protein [Pontibacter sp. Tf4]
MNKLITRSPLLLLIFLTAFLFACEKEEPLVETEIYGKITDIETGEPLTNVTINLISFGENLPNNQKGEKIIGTAVTDVEGNYAMLVPEIADKKLYTFDFVKDGYVRTRESNSVLISFKPNRKTQHDMVIGKGSYLKLTVKKTPNTNNTLKVFIAYSIDGLGTGHADNEPYSGTKYELKIDATKAESEILYDFYYGDTRRFNLSWEVTQEQDSQVKKYQTDIYLTEHDTTEFEINY